MGAKVTGSGQSCAWQNFTISE